jgi:hypothetical protein
VSLRGILLLLLLAAAGCGTAPRWQPPTEEQMAAVKAGMSPAEVRAALGGSAPDGGSSTSPQGETVSSWRIVQKGSVLHTAYFNVHYRDGKVVRTSRTVDVLSVPG